MSDDNETGLGQLDPASSGPARDARYFRRIHAAANAVAGADNELKAAVAQAREAGDSWAVIGAAMGVGEEAARERFDSER